jgi:hypothetical protein
MAGDGMTSLQKALDMLDDLGRRLDKIESAPLPLWMQGPARPASASPSPAGTIPALVLSKAVLARPGGPSAGATPALDPVSASAVLAELLNDPLLGTYVREKINRANF